MSKSVELTPSQIKAFENGATMFVFPIREKIFDDLKEGEWIDYDTYSWHLFDFIKNNAQLQKGDKEVWVREKLEKKLCIQDISSLCSYKTEEYNILNIDETENEYEDYFLFDEYSTWKKMIDMCNYYRTLVTMSRQEELEFIRLETYIVNNLNKCDFCKFEIPKCNGSILEYGKKNNDNVVSCDMFEEREQSRYSFEEVLDVRVVRVQDIEDYEIVKIVKGFDICDIYNEIEDDIRLFYNQQLKELNINRTYEDNDYVFLVEIKRN